MDPTSEALARQAQSGSETAFDRLVERHHAQIYHFLRLRCGNTHDAEDLTQETFLKAYHSLHRYDPNLPLLPWLFTIARRRAATHYRRFRPTEPLLETLEATGPEATSALEQEEEHQALWALAARTLKPLHHQALWLRYGEGFSMLDTARSLGLTQIHLKVILFRARKELGRHLKGRVAS